MVWDALAAGEGCPFDRPRLESSEHWDLVAALSVSSLYLHRIQTYRGYCVLVFDPRHETRLDRLSPREASAFFSDLSSAQRAISEVVMPDHMNVESLGNQIPHLHWHIIPRYKGDPRWGLPIWMTREEELPRVSLPDSDRKGLLQALKEQLAARHLVQGA